MKAFYFFLFLFFANISLNGQGIINTNYLITVDSDTINYIETGSRMPYPHEDGFEFIKYGEKQKMPLEEIQSFYVNNTFYFPLTVKEGAIFRRIFAHTIVKGDHSLFASQGKKGVRLYYQVEKNVIKEVPQKKTKAFFKENMPDFEEFESYLQKYSKGNNWVFNDFILGKTISRYNEFKNPEKFRAFKPAQYAKSSIFVLGGLFTSNSQLTTLNNEWEEIKDNPFNYTFGLEYQRRYNISSALVTGIHYRNWPVEFTLPTALGTAILQQNLNYIQIPLTYQHHFTIGNGSSVYLAGGLNYKYVFNPTLKSQVNFHSDYLLKSLWFGFQGGLGLSFRPFQLNQMDIEVSYDYSSLKKIKRDDVLVNVDIADSFFNNGLVSVLLKYQLFE